MHRDITPDDYELLLKLDERHNTNAVSNLPESISSTDINNHQNHHRHHQNQQRLRPSPSPEEETTAEAEEEKEEEEEGSGDEEDGPTSFSQLRRHPLLATHMSRISQQTTATSMTSSAFGEIGFGLESVGSTSTPVADDRRQEEEYGDDSMTIPPQIIIHNPLSKIQFPLPPPPPPLPLPLPPQQQQQQQQKSPRMPTGPLEITGAPLLCLPKLPQRSVAHPPPPAVISFPFCIPSNILSNSSTTTTTIIIEKE